jgi:hypothetical protein
MNWQEMILNRLANDSSDPRLVIDQTGVLLSPEFLTYLQQKKQSYLVCKNQAELLKAGPTTTGLLLCPKLPIPAYFNNKFTVIDFTLTMLPIQFEPELRQNLAVENLVILLNSFAALGKPHQVSRIGFMAALSEAKQGLAVLKLTKIKNEIQSLFQQTIDLRGILKLGELWGKYLYGCYLLNQPKDLGIQAELDSVVRRYIINQGIRQIFYSPAKTLQSVNKIQGYLAEQSYEKIALLCFDGMGWAEWELIKAYLQNHNLMFVDQAQFALIPTITSISRSALFSGEYETGFDKHSNDEIAFKHYWQTKGKQPTFFRSAELIGSGQLIGYDRVAILFNCIDDISHGMIIPKDSDSKFSYFKTIQTYCAEAKIENIFQLLRDSGYKLFICSDHGTTIATGNGRKIDKYLFEAASKRATIVEKSILTETVLNNEIQYNIPFIDDKIAIIAEERTMYGTCGAKEITHGGITVEELIVPFAEVVL